MTVISHYYLYSAFNNANCVKAALYKLDIKLGGFISDLQYLDGEIICVILHQARQNQQFKSRLCDVCDIFKQNYVCRWK